MKKNSIYIISVLSLGLIVFFWAQESGSLLGQGLSSLLLALGRLFALLAVYSILWQFLLSGRASFLEKEFGLDTLSRLHQKNGKIAITFILLHPLFITLSYSMSGRVSFWNQLVIFLTQYEEMLQAFLAVGAFAFIVGSSIYIVRRHLKYESWYFVHLLTYIAVVFAWGHQLELGGDFIQNTLFTLYWYLLYIFVFGLLAFFRFFLPVFRTLRHEFYISDVIPETHSTVSYYISGKNIGDFPVYPGQFMIFRFLAKNLWWEAHPFSLSKAPDGKSIRITAKKAGDFTKKLPSIQKGTKVFIDGPYGVFTAKKAKTDKILFLAGGVGITPIRSLIEEMGKKKKDIILLYQNKTGQDIVFKKELEALQKEHAFKMVHVISDDGNYQGEKGTINEHRIKQFAPDFLKRDIYFCGSPSFLRVTLAELKRLGVRNDLMHYEQFAFHA